MKRIIGIMTFLLAVLGFWNFDVQASEVISFYSTPGDALEKADEGETLEYTFDVDNDCITSIAFVTAQKSDIHIVLFNSDDKLISDMTLVGSSGAFDKSWSMYKYLCEIKLQQGNGYRLQLTFSAANEFSMAIGRAVVRRMPAITLAKGFSTKLDPNMYEVQGWESSNKKTATVVSGNVIAKKTGTTTITAVVKEKLKLSWKVKVVENAYKEQKIQVSSKNHKKRYMQVYKAYYSGKKLVLKTRIVNNTKIEYTQLRNLKLVVKAKNGKTIGTYKLSRKNVKIPKKSARNLTFVIKNPKLAKTDLTKAKVSVKGTLFYYK